MDEKIRANRTYKDSVFRMLFRSKAALLGLYNALSFGDIMLRGQLKGNKS